jgi:hypothetical protein
MHIGGVLLTAWQVLASLIGISFVIVVLLIEFFNSTMFESRALPVLVRKMFMLPIIFIQVLTLLSIGFNALLLSDAEWANRIPAAVTGINFALFGLSIGLMGFLYVRTFRVITPSQMTVLQREFQEELVEEILTREATNQLMADLIHRMCNVSGIEFLRKPASAKPNVSSVDLRMRRRQSGVIYDVNLSLLRLAARRAQQFVGSNASQALAVCIDPHDTWSSDRPQFAWLPIKASHRQVTWLLSAAVRIRPTGVGQEEDLRGAMQVTRRLLADALRSGNRETVESILDHWKDSIEHFLYIAERYPGLFQADQQRATLSPSIGWPVISLIIEDYRDLTETALQTADRHIIESWIAFPHDVMVSALIHGNPRVFRVYGDGVSAASVVAARVMAGTQRAHVQEQIAEDLSSLSRFCLGQRMDKIPINEQETKDVIQFANYITTILSNLAKAALDRRDTGTFVLFVQSLRRSPDLTNQYWETIDWDSISYLDMLGDVPHRPGAAPAEQARLVRDALRTIRSWTMIARFGLGAWLVHLLEADEMMLSEFKNYADAIENPINLAEMYRLFSLVYRDLNIEHEFQWHLWEILSRPDTGDEPNVEPLQFSDWLVKYYVFRSVRLAPVEIDATSEIHPHSFSRQLAEEVEKKLVELRKSPVWRQILIDANPAEFDAKAYTLQEMHKQAAVKQEKSDQDQLIAQPLDDGLVRQFDSAVRETWSKFAAIRALLKMAGRCEEHPYSQVPPELEPLTIQRLAPKAAFVGQSRVMSVNLGQNHGRALAREENHLLGNAFSELNSAQAKLEVFDSVLHEICQALKMSGFAPAILLNDVEMMQAISKCPSFEPRLSAGSTLPDVHGIQGVYEGLFVVSILGLQENSVVVVDLSRFGTLVQYRPDNGEQFPLSIVVTEITDSQAAKMIGAGPNSEPTPGSLQSPGRAARLRDLKQHVRVDIEEHIQFEVRETQAGKVIVFEK